MAPQLKRSITSTERWARGYGRKTEGWWKENAQAAEKKHYIDGEKQKRRWEGHRRIRRSIVLTGRECGDGELEYKELVESGGTND